MKMMGYVTQRVQKFQNELGATALVAVIKGTSLEKIKEALAAGVTMIAENRIQEAEQRFLSLNNLPTVKKHFIGHLQSNKIKKAVQLFDCIQSVDSLKIAALLNKEAEKQQKRVKVMIQINIGNEQQKHGILPVAGYRFYEQLQEYQHLSVVGLMCIAPAVDVHTMQGKKELHCCFRRMKELQNDLKLQHCSMGMTNDYKIAVAEGSTMVRIGRGIFGD